MDRVAGGCEDAARQLVREYGETIRRAVRRALKVRLRSKFDSLDFTQLVWCSVFQTRDRLGRFQNPGELAAFLVDVARKKVAQEARRHLQTDKYCLNRELPSAAGALNERAELQDRQPAAVDEAIARETLEGILSSQPHEVREIIELRLRGQTHEEIARSLHITRGAVHRFLKRLSHDHA
jgi:RNA polymerase sigma factor (sigma-70 family)